MTLGLVDAPHARLAPTSRCLLLDPCSQNPASRPASILLFAEDILDVTLQSSRGAAACMWSHFDVKDLSGVMLSFCSTFLKKSFDLSVLNSPGTWMSKMAKLGF